MGSLFMTLAAMFPSRVVGKANIGVAESAYASFLTMFDIIDPGKVFYKALYQVVVGIAEWLWGSVATLLGTAWIIRSLDNWMANELLNIADELIGGFGPYLVVAALIGITLYGAARVLNSFFPNFTPVDPERLLIYFALGAIYIGSASQVIGLAESLRDDVYQLVAETAYGGISGVFSEGTIFDDAPLGMAVSGTMSSGWDTAIAFVGFSGNEPVRFHTFPSRLIEGYPYIDGGVESGCCFRFAGNGSAFDGMDDNERSEATYQALDGLRVLWFAHAPAVFSIIEEFAKLLLTVAAYVIYFTIPLGFILSPFRLTAGVLSGYVNRYVALLAEVLLTAAFLGLGNALVVASLNRGIAAFMAATIIAFLIAIWRALSAFKLTTMSIQNAVESAHTVTGLGSALSLKEIQRVTTGSVTGGAMLAAGAATGNPALALGGVNQLTKAMSGTGLPGGAMLAAGGAMMYRNHKKNSSKGGSSDPGPSDALQATAEDGSADAAGQEALTAFTGAQADALGDFAGAAYGQMETAGRSARLANGSGLQQPPRDPNQLAPQPTLRTDSPAVANGQDEMGAPDALPEQRQADQGEAPRDDEQAKQPKGEGKDAPHSSAASAAQDKGRSPTSPAFGGTHELATPATSIGWGSGDVSRWLEATADADDSMRETFSEVGERRFGPASKRAAAMAVEGIEGTMEGVQAVDDYARQYTAEHGEAATVDHFRSGDAYAELSPTLTEGSPLLDADNFGAVADMVLEPSRPVSYRDVVSAMNLGDQDWDDPLDAVATNLGMPETHFAGADGTIRSAVNTASAIGATQPLDDENTYLEAAANFVAQGDRESAENVLYEAAFSAGVPDPQVTELVNDLDVVAAVFQDPRKVPQSVQFAPGDAQGREKYVQSQVNFNPALRRREQGDSLSSAGKERATLSPGAASSPTPMPTAQVRNNALHK